MANTTEKTSKANEAKDAEATEVEASETNDSADLVPVLFKVTPAQRASLKLVAAAEDSTLQGLFARLTEAVIAENKVWLDVVNARRTQAAA